jgi:hypothetical protein
MHSGVSNSFRPTFIYKIDFLKMLMEKNQKMTAIDVKMHLNLRVAKYWQKLYNPKPNWPF